MIIIVYEIPLKYWPRFVLYYHMADGNNPPFLEIGKFTNLIIIKVFKMIEKIQWVFSNPPAQQLMWIIFGRNKKYILEQFLLELYLEFMFVAIKVTIWHILQQQPPMLPVTTGLDWSHTNKMTSCGAVCDQSVGGLWPVTY